MRAECNNTRLSYFQEGAPACFLRHHSTWQMHIMGMHAAYQGLRRWPLQLYSARLCNVNMAVAAALRTPGTFNRVLLRAAVHGANARGAVPATRSASKGHTSAAHRLCNLATRQR